MSQPPPRKKPTLQAVPPPRRQKIAQPNLFDQLPETVHEAEWKGMPQFFKEDQKSKFSVKIHFQNEAAIKEFAERLGIPVTSQTRSAWFPKIEIKTIRDKRYIDEAEAAAEQEEDFE